MAAIYVHFRHISHSEESAEKVRRWLISELKSRNMYHHNVHLDVFFSKTGLNSEGHAGIYECHIRARAPWLTRELFVSDANVDFWNAFVDCSYLLIKKISRDLELKRTQRRQPVDWGVPPA